MTLLRTKLGILMTASILACAGAAGAQLPDHLQCHKFKDTQKFKFADVDLTAVQAAFQVPAGCRVKGKGKKFCVPVEKSVTETDAPGSSIGDGQDLSANDYVCYKMKCPKFVIADTLVTDQFGERNLLKIKTGQEICVPAVKGIVTTTTSTTTTTTHPPRSVFLTSGDYTGNVGGVAGADTICQGLADTALLPGTFLAWISTSHGNEPETRFSRSTGNYVNTNGDVVADNWTDLVDGSALDASIAFDAGGAAVILQQVVMTSTDEFGRTLTSNGTCQGWTSSSSSVDGLGFTTDTSLRPNALVACERTSNHLFCVEQ